MRRSKSEKIRVQPELIRRSGGGVALTREVLESYIGQLRRQGRREDSVRSCENTFRQFYEALPADKVIRRDSLAQWRERLLEEGYAIRTANSKVSSVNSLLESMDCREYQVSGQLAAEEYRPPELTRQEYLRMLQTARALEDERGYLLTKIFATTGIAVVHLPLVTVEAARRGRVQIQNGSRKELLRIPDCLREDLLHYAGGNGQESGTIFTQKTGAPLARTQVSLYIQKLAQDAMVPAEKGNIRCLRQLYQDTISGIAANFDLLVQQAYDRQLEMEQLSAGWENNA